MADNRVEAEILKEETETRSVILPVLPTARENPSSSLV